MKLLISAKTIKRYGIANVSIMRVCMFYPAPSEGWGPPISK